MPMYHACVPHLCTMPCTRPRYHACAQCLRTMPMPMLQCLYTKMDEILLHFVVNTHQIFMWFALCSNCSEAGEEHLPAGISLLNLFPQVPTCLRAREGEGGELSLLLSPSWDKNIDRQLVSDNWLLLNSSSLGPAVPNLSHWCKNNQSAGIEAIMGNSAVEQPCIRIPGLTLAWHSKVTERRTQGFAIIISGWNEILYRLIFEVLNLYFNYLQADCWSSWSAWRCVMVPTNLFYC